MRCRSPRCCSAPVSSGSILPSTDLYRFPPKDEEGFRSLRQKSCELVDQDVLNFVCLLNSYADANTIDARLDEDFLVLVSRYGEGVQ